jgi:hypothetical protein
MPKETCAEVGESNHKDFAKKLGRHCRMQHKSFANQVAQRLSDNFVIGKLVQAMNIIPQEETENIDDSEFQGDEVKESTRGATHFVTRKHQDGVEIKWKTKTESELLTPFHHLIELLTQCYHEEFEVEDVHCCTEYHRDTQQIRCHPCYKGEGPWFDWVLISFEEQTFNGQTYPKGDYPCKVMTVVPSEKNDFLDETELVVQCSECPTENDSVLFTEWKLMDGYQRVSANAIVCSVFVIELENNHIAVCLPYEEWPSKFTDITYEEQT